MSAFALDRYASNITAPFTRRRRCTVASTRAREARARDLTCKRRHFSQPHIPNMSSRKDGIARIAKLMAAMDFCMLTTRTKGGRLHARPMSNNGEVEFDGDVWFF